MIKHIHTRSLRTSTLRGVRCVPMGDGVVPLVETQLLLDDADALFLDTGDDIVVMVPEKLA